MIRVLPALKICFADGGQVGNQFAAQIGYKLREEKHYEKEISECIAVCRDGDGNDRRLREGFLRSRAGAADGRRGRYGKNPYDLLEQ